MLLAIVTFFLAQASKRSNERVATEEQEAEQLRIQQEISEEPEELLHCCPSISLGWNWDMV
ncbi:MAG: hypothetical protein CM15mP45_11660 [Deltaproteobacteria bacterium]|nr:MAG: hypothetical protein CM15mP45_11660 [Deltaproteobacteria bacterium]